MIRDSKDILLMLEALKNRYGKSLIYGENHNTRIVSVIELMVFGNKYYITIPPKTSPSAISVNDFIYTGNSISTVEPKILYFIEPKISTCDGIDISRLSTHLSYDWTRIHKINKHTLDDKFTLMMEDNTQYYCNDLKPKYIFKVDLKKETKISDMLKILYLQNQVTLEYLEDSSITRTITDCKYENDMIYTNNPTYVLELLNDIGSKVNSHIKSKSKNDLEDLEHRKFEACDKKIESIIRLLEEIKDDGLKFKLKNRLKRTLQVLK